MSILEDLLKLELISPLIPQRSKHLKVLSIWNRVPKSGIYGLSKCSYTTP